jgi:uncharacterized membrane protein YidH (DUF202 family)
MQNKGMEHDVRENLAIQRTKLAEERTALSYIRTGFSLLLGGVFFIGYFLPGTAFAYAGYGTVVVSILFILYGFYHHQKSMNVINQIIALPAEGVYQARMVGKKIVWMRKNEENKEVKKKRGNGKKSKKMKQ